MFSNQLNRYITRGINEHVPYLLQKKLWQLIDESVKRKERLDYLQVFKLEKEDSRHFQKIIHRQERPKRNKVVDYPINYLELDEAISIKVWVIDDGHYQTMLLPEEY